MHWLFYLAVTLQSCSSKAMIAYELFTLYFFKFPRSLCDFGFNDYHHKIAMTIIPSDADRGEPLYQNISLQK